MNGVELEKHISVDHRDELFGAGKRLAFFLSFALLTK
jgi:hypothetical protein